MLSYRLLSVALICFAVSAYGQEATPAPEAAPAIEAPASEAPVAPDSAPVQSEPAPAAEPPSDDAAADTQAPTAEQAPAAEQPPESAATPEPPVVEEAPKPEAAPAPQEAPSVAPERPLIDVRMPARGMTMEEVEKQFGAPSTKRPSVGKPPITRWVYADYTVYFERQYVIHSVLNTPSNP